MMPSKYYSVMLIVCSRLFLFSVAARFLIHLTYLAWTVIIASSFCNESLPVRFGYVPLEVCFLLFRLLLSWLLFGWLLG